MLLALLLTHAAHAAKNPTIPFDELARALGAAPYKGSCRYGPSELTRFELARMPGRDFEEAYPERWACVMLEDNLDRDSRGGCRPEVGRVIGEPIERHRTIRGFVRYMGLFDFPYAYDLDSNPAGHPVVTVRVHLTGDAARFAENIERMQRRMNEAADLWEKNSPDGIVHFRFLAVGRGDRPHFTVRLARNPMRKPYNWAWSLKWDAHLLAHEIGHMMGLDDEYNQIRKTMGHILGKAESWRDDERSRADWFRCDLRSLMCCSSPSPLGRLSEPRDYHYYVILRRRFCSND